MNWAAIKETRWIKFPVSVVGGFLRHNDMSLAAAVAFYMVVSFAPLVLLIVAIGGVLGGSAQSSLIKFFDQQLGPRASEVTQAIVESANTERYKTGSWGWIAGMTLLLISVSAVFAQLQSALNIIWEASPEAAATKNDTAHLRARKSWWSSKLHMLGGVWGYLRKRLLSLGMVLASLFILLISLVISSVMEYLVPGDGTAGTLLVGAVSFLLAAFLFAAMFRFLPDVPIRWRDVWIGSVITAGLFSIGKYVLEVYLLHSGIAEGYGKAAGGLIALAVWVYYSCIILFIGAEITQHISRHGDRNGVVPGGEHKTSPRDEPKLFVSG